MTNEEKEKMRPYLLSVWKLNKKIQQQQEARGIILDSLIREYGKAKVDMAYAMFLKGVY